jgi:uncharacterized membrane protein (DUF2068 family)
MGGAVKAVAAFEAFKGVVVLLASTALLSLVHKDLHALVLSLVEHMHLNPAARYPQIFLSAAGDLQNTRLVGLAIGAAGYSVLRFVEAFGLFRERAWAEILAAGSGAIYVPFELLGLWRAPTLLHLGLLIANVLVVVIMVRSLLRRRRWRSMQNSV